MTVETGTPAPITEAAPTTPALINTPTTQPTTPSTQPATPSDSWYSGFDQDTVAWMDNRGITKLDQSEALKNTIQGFRNAEKYMGVPPEQLVRIPDFNKADQTDLDAFYNKLGRPSDAKDYTIPVPDGQDTSVADWARGVFHKAGLTATQAEMIAKEWNAQIPEMGKQFTAKEAEQFAAKKAEQDQALRKEWGVAYDQELDVAESAAQAMQMNPQQIAALESALGFDGTVKMLNRLGKAMGEDKFVVGQTADGFNKLTPSAARMRIQSLQQDPEWSTKYLSGNASHKLEMERLMKMAYPDEN